MRVACIYPSPIMADYNIISGEPLGLLYIAGVAKSLVKEVKVFVPEVSETRETFIEKILAFSPDLLAFSAMTFQANPSVEILYKIKQEKRDLVSIVGGPHASLEPEFFLSRGFDVCVIGEGEITFGDIMMKLSKNESIKGIPGTACLVNEKIIYKPQSQRANLDEICLPIRIPRFIDGKTYTGLAYPAPHIKAWASINTMRGCPYSCTFCSAPQMWNRKVTRRSLENVIEEMNYLHETYDVELFQFVDLVFALDNQYTIDLCRAINRSKLNVNWFCMTHANTINNMEMLYAMKEAGCSLISIGVESLNKNTLSQLNKKSKNVRIDKLIDVLDSIGMPVNIFYMIGFPWQSPQDIFSEVELLYELKAHKIQIFIATPFPKTPFWYKVKNNLFPNSYHLYDTNHLVFKHPHFSPEEVKDIQNMIVRNFYLNTNYAKRIKAFLDKFPKYEESFQYYWKTLPFFSELKKYLQIADELMLNTANSYILK